MSGPIWKKTMKRFEGSATIKDHSQPPAPRGRVVKPETATHRHTSRQPAQTPADSVPLVSGTIKEGMLGSFSYFSIKNICFYGELTKIILQVSSDTLLICSSAASEVITMLDRTKLTQKHHKIREKGLLLTVTAKPYKTQTTSEPQP